MKKILTVLTLFLTLSSCDKEETKENTNACNLTNPLDAEWLLDIKNSLQDCYCEMSIVQGEYEGQTVFYLAMTDALCDGVAIPTLLDCEGEAVRVFTEEDYTDFNDVVIFDTVLYRCNQAN